LTGQPALAEVEMNDSTATASGNNFFMDGFGWMRTDSQPAAGQVKQQRIEFSFDPGGFRC
jgi:hypothetical protein